MNILIISSNNTGAGHKSIAEALIEEFNKHSDIHVKVIDGFDTIGVLGNVIGKSYGFTTRKAKLVWKFAWKISLKEPRAICKLIETAIEKNLLKILEEEEPDLILCIHPNFNTPVLNILYKNGIFIPFITLIADLVSITPLWVDTRADYIICPTEEAKDKCIQYKASESKIRVTRFPVRSKFYEVAFRKEKSQKNIVSNKLEFLIMSGAEGVGDLGSIAEILLNDFDCKIRIVTGRNKNLKEKLEDKLYSSFGNKVEVLGYVTDIHKLMQQADILISRGSPNVLMEAIVVNLPIIITGDILGQEQDTPDYIENNNLGVVCKNFNDLSYKVKDLLFNGGEKLNRIKEAQRNYRDPHSVKNIADIALDTVNDGNMFKEYLDEII